MSQPEKWTKELTLAYMRAHQPFTTLPQIYYPCTKKSIMPPKFLYGFAFPDTPKGDALLAEMQAKLPIELQDEEEYSAKHAICAYIADQLEVTAGSGPEDALRFTEIFSTSLVDSARPLFIFRFFSSYEAPSPELPTWVCDIARVAEEIFRELGWKKVPKPSWYLDNTTPLSEDEDYNRVRKLPKGM